MWIIYWLGIVRLGLLFELKVYLLLIVVFFGSNDESYNSFLSQLDPIFYKFPLKYIPKLSDECRYSIFYLKLPTPTDVKLQTIAHSQLQRPIPIINQSNALDLVANRPKYDLNSNPDLGKSAGHDSRRLGAESILRNDNVDPCELALDQLQKRTERVNAVSLCGVHVVLGVVPLSLGLLDLAVSGDIVEIHLLLDPFVLVLPVSSKIGCKLKGLYQSPSVLNQRGLPLD